MFWRWSVAGGILAASAVLLYFLLSNVSLVPHVGRDFFFSPEDPQLADDKAIAREFGSQELVIVTVEGDIDSASYYDYVRKLSESLLAIEHVYSVRSLTHGPEDLEEATSGPLWKRLVIASNGKATNLLLMVSAEELDQYVPRVIEVVERFQTPYFKPYISGVPYMIDRVQEELTDDLIIFSTTAAVVFGMGILLVFRSLTVLLGLLVCCADAAIATLFLIHFFGIQIGVLTANVITIAFVLTVSHVVFLTHSWHSVLARDSQNRGRCLEAVRLTLPASFWSMLTTALGFGMLIASEAKPLRELGITGALAAGCGFIVAYLIYPAFMSLVRGSSESFKQAASFAHRLRSRKFAAFSLLLLGAALLCVAGMWQVNTDPALASYFEPGGDIRKGVEYVDRNGGSSPLMFAITASDGDSLTTSDNVEKMWKLHKKLEEQESVGSVISLPVLLEQADEHPFSFLVSWEYLVEILEGEEYDDVAGNFITKDRKTGLFILRMKEHERTSPRGEIIASLKRIIEKQGFRIKHLGGMYSLQSQMAELLKDSILSGIARLLPIYFLLAWIAARSLIAAACLTLSLAVIPALILGSIGYVRMPIDLVTAPAAMIAISLGVDQMFHFIRAYRLRLSTESDHESALVTARVHLTRPVVYSTFLIAAGFGTFLLSNFPPTSRFGVLVCAGTTLAGLSTLTLFPFLLRTFISGSAQERDSEEGQAETSQ